MPGLHGAKQVRPGRVKRSKRVLLREALAIGRTSRKENNLDIAVEKKRLADLLHATKRYNEAFILAKDAYETELKTNGKDNLVITYSMIGLATCHLSYEHYNEAESLLKEGFEIRQRLLGAESPLTADLKARLAKIYFNTGRENMALVLQEEALNTCRTKLGNFNKTTTIVMCGLAHCY